MKSTIVIVAFFVGVFQVLAGPNMNCGPMPAKKPSECCADISKICKEEAYEKCETENKGDMW
jgi:hypothetical protein